MFRLFCSPEDLSGPGVHHLNGDAKLDGGMYNKVSALHFVDSAEYNGIDTQDFTKLHGINGEKI